MGGGRNNEGHLCISLVNDASIDFGVGLIRGRICGCRSVDLVLHDPPWANLYYGVMCQGWVEDYK